MWKEFVCVNIWYFGHLMRRVDSLEKTLMLGGIGGRRRRGRQRMGWLDGITDFNGRESQWTPGVGDGQGGLACCDSWGRKESDTTEQLIWSDGDGEVKESQSLVKKYQCRIKDSLKLVHILIQLWESFTDGPIHSKKKTLYEWTHMWLQMFSMP